MFYFNLQPLLAARGIENPTLFLIKAGISRNTAHQLLYNRTGSISLKNMERLCSLLYCTPNELFVWQPSTNAIPLAEGHPLKQLVAATTDEMTTQLKQIPLADLKKLLDDYKNTQAL